MPDLPGRKEPRFPPDRVPAAGKEIAEKVRQLTLGFAQDQVRAFASLARGGDILFHEACRAQGLRSVVILPFNVQVFLETSVHGEAGWARRFESVWNATPETDRRVLGLPVNDSAYVACNNEIMKMAQAWGNMRLIALWDGSDVIDPKPGGAGDFVKRSQELGIEPTIIDPATL